MENIKQQVFSIVKSIVSDVIDIERITNTDGASYFSIHIDGCTHKPICRLYWDTSQKHINIWDDNDPAKELRYDISSPDEIYTIPELSDRLKCKARYYRDK
jgi:hypothetical protein